MRQEAYFCTVKELDELGKNNIPQQLISHTHLIYSSPATLAFNSPGAEGFGVKRAGLAVPDSIMLIVSPGCCGRNTSVLSSMQAYHDRFYYLLMDETDIVTGRHLKKIPKAVAEICEGLEKKPSVVMICITCVDALLGTDMERVNIPSGLSSHTNTTIFLSSVCFMPAPYENHQTATSGGTARSVTTATAFASLH